MPVEIEKRNKTFPSGRIVILQTQLEGVAEELILSKHKTLVSAGKKIEEEIIYLLRTAQQELLEQNDKK